MIKFCSLFSGSSGNCIFVKFGNTKLLVDSGLSGKAVIEALKQIEEDPSTINGLLVTHEHSDHVRGAGIISRKFDIPIYANAGTWDAMEREIGVIKEKNIKCFTTGNAFHIDDIAVNAFSIPHDAAEPVGYNFFCGNRKITVATDIGHMTKSLLANLEDSDLLLLEANHDIEMLKVGPYPWYLKKRILGENGHLCNDMAGKVVAYLAERGTKRFLLGHLSKENNFPELAFQTVYNALTEKKICVGTDVTLEVALRDRASAVIEVG